MSMYRSLRSSVRKYEKSLPDIVFFNGQKTDKGYG